MSGRKRSVGLAVAACLLAATAMAQQAPRPLISHLYTADPSARVFNGKIYLYPSHDVDAGVPEDDLGSHFAMNDYHVFSMDSVGGQVTDHGVALALKNVPWAEKQLWAPDAAYKNGTYYLYFPAKDRQGVFRIGVATSGSPSGPFKARARPMKAAYSIDPAVFTDADGKSYLYFGGIWGGQLQRWQNNTYDADGSKTDLQADDRPAVSARVARLAGDMLELAEPPREVQLLDEAGKPLAGGDHNRRFFEGAWLHRHNGQYYFSYSTGDTHLLAYAVGNSPYGPFTYKGVLLRPVSGWTTHHSIVETGGRWYLFYHDVELSGKTHLRNVKVRALERTADGGFVTITP